MILNRGLPETKALSEPDTAEDIADRIKKMSSVLRYCADDVRYDLQRNLIREIEILCKRSPLSLSYRKAFRDVANVVIEDYDSPGRVHVALRRLADQAERAEQPKSGASLVRFNDFARRVLQIEKAERFLVDRQLARREDCGALSLTIWGRYVLEHLDKRQARARDNANIARLPEMDDVSP